MEIIEEQDILVYGAGDFFHRNKEKIEHQYNIKAIIDRNKKGILENCKIIKMEELVNFSYEKILIMVDNVKDCFLITRDLLRNGVEAEKILWGSGVYGFYADKYDEIRVLPNGKICVKKNRIEVTVGSADEFNNVYETLIEECYHYKINNDKKDIVIDVGMNVGDATLYFLADDKVEKVYAFEPFLKTFMAARQNLKKYINDSSRLEIFQYGLSNVTEEREITFNEDMTCGLSTKSTEKMNGYNVYDFYYDNKLAEQHKEKLEKITVKNAVTVLSPIVEQHKRNNNIILKMDCEGEEYGIIEVLNKENVLSQIDFIMLEWHYQGKGKVIDELSKAGFSYLCTEQRENMGQLCAWHNGR